MRLGQRSPQPRPRPLRPGAGVALPLGSTRCSIPSSRVAFLLTASHPNLQVQRGPPLPRACAGHLAGLACRVATCATPVLLVPTRYHVKLPWSGPPAHCLPQENAHPPGARAPSSLTVPSAGPAPGTESVRPGYLRSESSGRRNQACPRALGISRSEPQPSRHSDPRRVVTAVRVRYRHRGPGFSLGHTQPAAPAPAGSCAQPGAHSRSAGCRLVWWGVFGRAARLPLPPSLPPFPSCSVTWGSG